jgi:hypothetical protein
MLNPLNRQSYEEKNSNGISYDTLAWFTGGSFRKEKS